MEERNNRAVEFGTELNTHLQRLGELRKTMPRDTAPDLSNVRHLPAKRAPERTTPATAEQIIRAMAVLDVVFPSSAMTIEERSLRYRIFCADLAHLSEQQVLTACKRYRTNPENKFFPTPGMLLALAR